MTSDPGAPTPDEPKQGDMVVANERPAVFLYRRGDAAIIRYFEEGDSRTVPCAKLQWRSG